MGLYVGIWKGAGGGGNLCEKWKIWFWNVALGGHK